MATQSSKADSSTTPIDHDTLFLQAVSGSSKGRIYGFGLQASVGFAHTILLSRHHITKQEIYEAVARAISPLHEQCRLHEEQNVLLCSQLEQNEELHRLQLEQNEQLHRLQQEHNEQLRQLREQIALLMQRFSVPPQKHPPPPPNNGTEDQSKS